MPVAVSNFELIENNGPNSVHATLKTLFDAANAVDVHVAFTTSSGLDLLLARLRKVTSKGQVRFLTGLYQGCTEPRALRTLLKAQTAHGARFQVRLSTETNFHRKAFLARSKATLHMVVGSSNFTANGLLSAGELNVLVSLPARTKKAMSISSAFERAWNDGVPLTNACIKKYDELTVRPVAPSMPKMQLKTILGAETKHTKSSSASGMASTIAGARAPKRWIDGIAGFVSKQTEFVISDETNWDKRDWDWNSCNQDGYATGDEILMLDRSSKPRWAFLVRVMATARTATKTRDGRHFSRTREFRE